MALDDIGSDGDLFATPQPQVEQQQQTPPPPSASQALVQTAEVIAAPQALAVEVLASDPAKSGLPLPLAILGACVAAAIWANSLDKRK